HRAGAHDGRGAAHAAVPDGADPAHRAALRAARADPGEDRAAVAPAGAGQTARATISSSTAYRAVFATATIATNCQKGTRSKPATTVSGSPTTGTHDASSDHFPQRAQKRSARWTLLPPPGSSRRPVATARPMIQFTHEP